MSITAVGIISDTHSLLRPEAVAALRGSDLILHAGDIGSPDVLQGLRKLAPVIAVRGNVDTGDWAASLPFTAVAEIGARHIWILHKLEDLDLDPAAAGFSAVVYGHSHRPSQETKAGIIYLNPGSAGPRRFRLPVTLVRADFQSVPPRIEFVDLLAGSGGSPAHSR